MSGHGSEPSVLVHSGLDSDGVGPTNKWHSDLIAPFAILRLISARGVVTQP